MDIIETTNKPQNEPMLPMINVVFLLLIFFMLAGALTTPELFRVTAPLASMTEAANKEGITVLMSDDHRFAIGTTAYAKDDVITFIKQAMADKKQINVRVQLKADQQVKSQEVIDFIDALGEAGLEYIQLLTVTEHQKP